MKAMALLLMLAWGLNAGLATGQTASVSEHEQTARLAAKLSMPSISLTLRIEEKATTLSRADLLAMPQTSLTVKNGHSGAMETYTGVAVGDLLAKYGFAFEGATAKQVYHSYVRAEGTDGYWVLYSAPELEGVLRETGSVVALMLDGKPLAGSEGQFKMVVAGEKRPARWVRNLKTLTVVRVE